MSNSPISILEGLPPELFLEIFCFLNGYDIYKAFYGLNHHLSALVLTYGIKYIDLSEITLIESQKMLSVINCWRVNDLTLSNKHNDEQIDQLLDNNHFPLQIFNSLRSLTFDSIGLFTLHSIIRQHFDLINLESLLIDFRSDLCQEKVFDMYRIILNRFCFRFKSLKVLCLSISNINEIIIHDELIPSDPFSSSIEISSSLHYLMINSTLINDIEAILLHFPNLYFLYAIVKLDILISDYPLLPNLTCCILVILSSQFESLVNLLKQCSNLEELTLFISPADNDALASYQWENLIGNYLLKLKQFKVDMLIVFIPMTVIQDLFTNHFLQNQFWLDRKTKFDITKEESTNDNHLKTEVMIEFKI